MGRQMYMVNVLAIVGCLLTVSCKSKRPVVANPTEVESKCQWVIPGRHVENADSNNYDNSEVALDCFPNFEHSTSSFTNYEIKVFDRWGQLQFESTDTTEFWVCNGGVPLLVEAGTYFYVVNCLFDRDTAISNVSGTITILCD